MDPVSKTSPAEGTGAGVPERDLLAAFAALPPGDPARADIREALVVMHQPLVRSLARRYAGRGEPLDDLVQVANEGLIKAVDRYDPARGDDLAAFVVPTVLGEIRRHFRDRTWSVRVPRRMQELGRKVETAREELGHELGRSPTVQELAERLAVTTDDVLEALEAAAAYASDPLDATDLADGSRHLAAEDDELARVLHRQSLRPAIARLEPREKAILRMRFLENRTQEEIAAEVGLTQSQVSRTLNRTLVRLRDAVGAES